MENFRVLRKRDGQNWENFGEIYAVDFDDAKRKFAHNMTSDNHNKSNNICWLRPEDEDYNLKEEGWYDLTCLDSSGNPELFCSKESIENGFYSWKEDVYSYKLQNIYKLIIDGEEEAEYNADSLEEAIEEAKEDSCTDDVIEKVKTL